MNRDEMEGKGDQVKGRAKQAWGDVDKKITDLAPGIPWLWDKQPILHSKNVNGVVNVANASWDLTFTSVK